ncbi:hypothetical protein ABE562_19110, partial [Brucella intermedia]|uniref:hypothetical protein n=1 Tax=Brucella intermedia TaxID=94625 RepID=UPI00320A1AF7
MTLIYRAALSGPFSLMPVERIFGKSYDWSLTVLFGGVYMAPQRGRRRRKRQADASLELVEGVWQR